MIRIPVGRKQSLEFTYHNVLFRNCEGSWGRFPICRSRYMYGKSMCVNSYIYIHIIYTQYIYTHVYIHIYSIYKVCACVFPSDKCVCSKKNHQHESTWGIQIISMKCRPPTKQRYLVLQQTSQAPRVLQSTVLFPKRWRVCKPSAPGNCKNDFVPWIYGTADVLVCWWLAGNVKIKVTIRI